MLKEHSEDALRISLKHPNDTLGYSQNSLKNLPLIWLVYTSYRHLKDFLRTLKDNPEDTHRISLESAFTSFYRSENYKGKYATYIANRPLISELADF